jgi:hypothetical protein
MMVNSDIIWWGNENKRRKGIKLIGTIPNFGWRYNVGRIRSLGLQISLGVFHLYFIFWF